MIIFSSLCLTALAVIPHTSRSFHCSPVWRQRPDHPLFGEIDWTQIQAGKYAVVDPLDPANILYLTHREYVTQSRVIISNDMTLVVLATPRDTKPENTARPDTSSSDVKSTPLAGKAKSYTRRLSHWFNVDSRRARIGRLRLAFSSPLAEWAPSRISEKKSLQTSKEGARKGERVVSMIEVTGRNAERLVMDWGDLLWFRLFGCKLSLGFGKGLSSFGRYVAMQVHHTGALNTVLRLKAELHAVLCYVAGSPLRDTNALGIRVRLRHGLPASLSSQTRLAIREGNVASLRLWVSILNMFRALKAPHPQPSLGRITYPAWEEGKSALWDDFNIFCRGRLSSMLGSRIMKRGESSEYFRTKDLYGSTKAGPHGKSLLASRADLVVWMQKASAELGYFKDKVISFDERYTAFKSWWTYVQVNQDRLVSLLPLGQIFKLTGERRLSRVLELLSVLFPLDEIADSTCPPDLKFLFEWKEDFERPGLGDPNNPRFAPVWAITKGLNAPRLAKLVPLREPAGKVRNIVCFDWWSQSLLLPMHNFLMKMLRNLPGDATFDQDGAVKKFSEKGYSFLASYDLKTATEMIPQQLYRAVMGVILGPEMADAWLRLLVDRDVYPTDEYHCSANASTFRYKRGQPMGALSSWPAMALVHHAVVQFSAYLCGWRVWFKDYLVLGDDIIIANEAVADTYLKVCSDFGIEVGLAKSFVSRKGFGSFAGRFFLNDTDLSPVSLSEEIAIRGPAARMELVWRSVRRGVWSLGDTNWLTCLLRWSLPRSAFQQIQDWRYGRKVDPLLRAVFMAAFGMPERLDKHLGSQGLSIRSFFAGLNLTLKIFGMPLKDYFDRLICNNRRVSDPLITAIFAKARRLDKMYRPLWAALQRLSAEESKRKKYLSVVPPGILPKEREWLRDVVELYDTFERVLQSFRDWRGSHMRLVRTVLVAVGDGNINEHLLTHTCDKSLDEIWNSLSEAERTLPVALDALLGEQRVGRADPLASVRSLDRLLNSLEHLVEASMPPCETSESSGRIAPEESGLTPTENN